MSELDKEFYKAKAAGDSAKFAEVKAKCVAAGYNCDNDFLTATGAVKNAPPAPSKTLSDAKFKGDAKGIKKS